MFKGLALPFKHWRDPNPGLTSQEDIPKLYTEEDKKTRTSSLLRKLNGIKELFIVVENEDACRYTDVTFEPPTKSPVDTFWWWEFVWPAWLQPENKNERASEEELKSSWPALTRRLELILEAFKEKREVLIANLKRERGGTISTLTILIDFRDADGFLSGTSYRLHKIITISGALGNT